MRPSNKAINESKRLSNKRSSNKRSSNKWSSIEEREFIIIFMEGEHCTRPNRKRAPMKPNKKLAPRPRPNKNLAIKSITWEKRAIQISFGSFKAWGEKKREPVPE